MRELYRERERANLIPSISCPLTVTAARRYNIQRLTMILCLRYYLSQAFCVSSLPSVPQRRCTALAPLTDED